MLGWTADEAIGRDGAIIWTPEDRAAGLPEREMRLADAAGTAADERWHLRRDGSRIWGSGHLTPLRNGRPRGYLKVLRDRTAERRAEEATRESEARAAFLLKLSDATRPLADPAAIQRTAARLLREHLHAGRVLYAEIEGDEAVIRHDDCDDGLPSIAGRHPLAVFGEVTARRFLAGETLVMRDLDAAGHLSAGNGRPSPPSGCGQGSASAW